jgi:hypothetical protein
VINILSPLQGLLIAGWLLLSLQAPAQPAAAPVEKLGPSSYRIGRVQLDTVRREVVVPGKVNAAATLEFLAGTVNGLKEYETLLSLDVSAVSFNTAMLLIGLDPSHARLPAMQFDPQPPRGDPVEISIEWQDGSRRRRVTAEELIWDQRTKKTLREGPWVYTGSGFIDDGNGKRYLAELDGVLIGFMHGPQSIIDSPLNDAITGYGSFVLNPNLGLKENTSVSVTIKALPLDRKQR